MYLSVIATCILMPAATIAGDWTPPKNPMPGIILQEAKDDANRGHHKRALQKHIWYHENAEKIEKGQGAVRLSFALSHWLELAEAYPPALEEMRQVRDETEKKIRDKKRVRVRFADFHDFVALNRTLREEKRTVDTFAWLDKDDPIDAKRVFGVSRHALVKFKAYELCGKYIDTDKDLARIKRTYQLAVRMLSDSSSKAAGNGKQKPVLTKQAAETHKSFADKKVVVDSATLVALLVKNERLKEAKRSAAEIRKFFKDDALFKKLDMQLNEASKGKMPAQWP